MSGHAKPLLTIMLEAGEVAQIDSETLDRYDGNCALCKWFRGAYDRANRVQNSGHWVDDEGWCVRFPPIFIGGERDASDDCDVGRFKQPGVSGSDECGEYVKGWEPLTTA